ncbi:MAG: hypothetical protein OEX06_03335, partial [Candidatus Bathyarchaeota archaeon]|nr:hypothetical protein [Candidatus Bathyarchaeota archaeon]MDH5701963.1 hypothetical protein [Candidatus Bathyarchaeota archaeon]
GTMIEESSFDTRKAIICFQYVERIKSELIIAVKLLEKLNELNGDELAGAKKMMLSFLDALAGEITIAHGVLGLRNFEEARDKILDAAGKILSQDYLEATNNISKAISSVTTSGSRAMQMLKEKNIL